MRVTSSWPRYSLEIQERVANVLASGKVNYWTGDLCTEFEDKFANFVGVDHAIAVANGTLALEFSLRALGIKPGDEVIVTPRSFFASAAAVVTVGAVPVFADVDKTSQNISAQTVEPVISEKTKAIIVVHLAGLPAELDGLIDLADRHGIYILEDCAQAHGAKYKGRSVGSFGHISSWSFCQDKIMSTGGEGGMVTTNDDYFHSFVWSYKDHGKSLTKTTVKQNKGSRFRWLHDSFGTNGRMLELQAAIGIMQLAEMEQATRTRFENMSRLRQILSSSSALFVPPIPEYIVHGCYKCYVFVDLSQLKKGFSRDTIIDEIISRGIPVFSGSCPEIYREKAFEDLLTIRGGEFPVAEGLGETSLMFQVDPTLSLDDMSVMGETVLEVLGYATDNQDRW